MIWPCEHLLVLGLPNSPRNECVGNLAIRSHLSGIELAEAMFASQLIVSRSGYTTLMDLAAIGRSALIIPTPGQAEQEYLGDLHARTGRFLVQRQDQLDVKAMWAKASSLRSPAPWADSPLLEQALEDLAALLR